MFTAILVLLAITVAIDAITLTMLFNSVANNKHYSNNLQLSLERKTHA